MCAAWGAHEPLLGAFGQQSFTGERKHQIPALSLNCP